jgi:hypothetical protein
MKVVTPATALRAEKVKTDLDLNDCIAAITHGTISLPVTTSTKQDIRSS